MRFITIWLITTMAAAFPAQRATTERFDYLVRADFFAGAAGDEARLAKAIDLCERTLAANPSHAEAMVWHGAAMLVRSGQAFRAGDGANGGRLFQQGLDEMNKALEVKPDSPGVLIPRGAVLFEATRGMPPDMARPLIQSAIANYEHALELQQPIWSSLGDHARGELLFGLAEGFARLGDPVKARGYFDRLVADAPTSGQAPKAKEWIATGTVPKTNGMSCTGCHK